jgi:hypothetical protein
MSKGFLLVVISLVTVMMVTAWSFHLVLADPLHCDIEGWPSCYSVGYSNGLANPGTNGAATTIAQDGMLVLEWKIHKQHYQKDVVLVMIIPHAIITLIHKQQYQKDVVLVMIIPHAIITLLHKQHYQKDVVLVMIIPHAAVQSPRVNGTPASVNRRAADTCGNRLLYLYKSCLRIFDTTKSFSSSSPVMTLSIVLVTSNKAFSYPLDTISAESLQSNNV